MNGNVKEPDGVLLLDKAAGMTSHDAVNRLRRLLGTKKIGHAGTLDPMATGLLIMLVGRGAKAAEYITHERKSYRAALRLGFTSDTGDITGEVREGCVSIPNADAVKAAAAEVSARGKQTPPMYSAIKIGGQKLVDLARKGIEVERPERDITVYSHEIAPVEGTDGDYTLTCSVSGGTYIRTLITDIGDALGCGAVMTSLRRTEGAGFSLDDAVTLEELEAMEAERRLSFLRPTEQLFSDLERMALPPFFERLFRGGCPIYISKLGKALEERIEEGTRLAMYGDGGFFALGEVKAVPPERKKDENGEYIDPEPDETQRVKAIVGIKHFY